MEVGHGTQLGLSVCGQPLVMAIESRLSNMNRQLDLGLDQGAMGAHQMH